MKQIIRVINTIKKLDLEYQKEIERGSFIKETHISQSPYDQPYFIAVRDGVEIHVMLGYPYIREKKRYNHRYNKEFEENQKKKKVRRKRK